MEIYNKDKVEIRVRFNVEKNQTYGEIYYGKKNKELIGKVINDECYLNTNFILHKGVIKINEVQEVSRVCEEFKKQIENYGNLFRPEKESKG